MFWLFRLWQLLAGWLHLSAPSPAHYWARGGASSAPTRRQGKPEWVAGHILRLKSLMPAGTGVRKIAQTFNRQQAEKSRVRLSKTYVANVIRANLAKVQATRSEVRSRAPRASRNNGVWGVDLTGKCDAQGSPHHILAIIDHGSRRLLRLAVCTKRSAILANESLAAIAAHDRPRRLRTDNERCFTSRVFLLAAVLAWVKVQHIELSCPWQNGRLERFFGTLKQHLKAIEFSDASALQNLLDEFMVWYNEVRPHQHLGGATPMDAWRRIDFNKDTPRSFQWWTGWGGLLSDPMLRGENLCIEADCTWLNANLRKKSQPMSRQNTNSCPLGWLEFAKNLFRERETSLAGQWTGQNHWGIRA